MNGKILAALSLVIAFASAMPFEMVEDNTGEQYYLVPLQRGKRHHSEDHSSTSYDIKGPKLTGIVKHEGTFVRTDNVHLGGSTYATKDLTNLKHLRPEQYGGDVKLSHVSGVAATLAAEHQRGGPTDVRAGLNYNFFQNKDAKLDLTAEYSRQYGGPQGAGKPDAAILLQGEVKY